MSFSAPVVTEQPALRDVEEDDGRTANATHSGSITPPHPDSTSVYSLPFARRAGLQQGSGATVVLRVQVLGNGAVGQVQVDVSGGSLQVDNAAIDYVRTCAGLEDVSTIGLRRFGFDGECDLMDRKLCSLDCGYRMSACLKGSVVPMENLVGRDGSAAGL